MACLKPSTVPRRSSAVLIGASDLMVSVGIGGGGLGLAPKCQAKRSRRISGLGFSCCGILLGVRRD